MIQFLKMLASSILGVIIGFYVLSAMPIVIDHEIDHEQEINES